MRQSRFHGRYDTARTCEAPHCDLAGEFRAPGRAGSTFDGPGDWRWFCLDHVREFNAGYDWFEGMSAEEIFNAQAPGAGWRTESPTFRAAGVGDGPPKWADFDDPLEAISARAGGIRNRVRRDRTMAADPRIGVEEAAALEVLGLGQDADRERLRRRYSELVRRYHPDRNGGDRKFEMRLGRVVDAYHLLRKSGALR